MRIRLIVPLAGVAALAVAPAPAGAVLHTVKAGESLWSIAATDGLSVSQLAAANGLSTHSQLLVGTNVTIPPRGAVPAGPVTSAAPVASASPSAAVDGDGDHDGDMSDAPATAGSARSATAAPATAGSATAAALGAGSYVVVPGDSLWAIAARAGTTVASLAAANGLRASAPLLSGTVLRVSTTSAAAPAQAAPAPPTRRSIGPPYPTPETMSASQIGQIGANNGATWSLTDAIAWQESGFRNYVVARDGGVGIMQIMPDTWRWIQSSLDTGVPLNPSSAADNVRAGSLMLHWLLNQTGDPALAAAGYNEGLATLRRRGIIPQTQQYVRNVMTLRARFGGG